MNNFWLGFEKTSEEDKNFVSKVLEGTGLGAVSGGAIGGGAVASGFNKAREHLLKKESPIQLTRRMQSKLKRVKALYPALLLGAIPGAGIGSMLGAGIGSGYHAAKALFHRKKKENKDGK